MRMSIVHKHIKKQIDWGLRWLYSRSTIRSTIEALLRRYITTDQRPPAHSVYHPPPLPESLPTGRWVAQIWSALRRKISARIPWNLRALPLNECQRNGSRGHGRFEQDYCSGERAAFAQGIGFGANARRPVSRVVRSTRRKCRADTSPRQLFSREKEANRLGPRCSPRRNLTLAVVVGIAVLTCQLAEYYLRAVGRCATCAMGMMGMFKWLRK